MNQLQKDYLCLYHDKTWVFDQSVRVQAPIYIIKCNKGAPTQYTSKLLLPIFYISCLSWLKHTVNTDYFSVGIRKDIKVYKLSIIYLSFQRLYKTSCCKKLDRRNTVFFKTSSVQNNSLENDCPCRSHLLLSSRFVSGNLLKNIPYRAFFNLYPRQSTIFEDEQIM